MTKSKILVVDDDRKIVDLVRLYLERDGYRVLVAYDGLKALELARQRRPDLVVLDLLLPEVDGLDVCRIPANRVPGADHHAHGQDHRSGQARRPGSGRR